MTSVKAEANAVAQQDRKWKIYSLKKRGWSNQEIAIQLDMKASDVVKMIRQIVKEKEEETAVQVLEARQLIIERLGDALDAIYDQVQDGKLAAIDRMIAINRQHSELLGLKIDKIDVTTGGESLNLNAEDLAEAARLARLELKTRGVDGSSAFVGKAKSSAGMD